MACIFCIPRLFGAETKASAVFNTFDPRSYIDTYYPPIPETKDALVAAGKIRDMFSATGHAHLTQIHDTLHVPSVTLENIAVLEFFRSATIELMHAFPQRNASVLDVGGGPTTYQHLPCAFFASSIVHSEFVAKNRQMISAWIEKKSDTHRWNTFSSLFVALLRDTPGGSIFSEEERKILQDASGSLLEERVRDLLTRGAVVFGDIFKNIIERHDHEQFDVVTAHFAVESATKEQREWEMGLSNLCSRVRDGGYLITTAIRNSSSYHVGNRDFPATSIDEHIVERFMQSKRFSIKKLFVLEGMREEGSDYDGMIFLVAQRLA